MDINIEQLNQSLIAEMSEEIINEETIKELISQGANVNIQSEGNKTPLMLMIEHENIGIIELLIEKMQNWMRSIFMATA